MRVTVWLLCVFTLAGCSTTTLPAYQGSVENVQLVRTHIGQALALGAFGDESGVSTVGARLATFESPYENSFSEYLKQALKKELETGGRYRDGAPLVVEGVLRENQLNADSDLGTAKIQAAIRLMNAGKTLYEKKITAEHNWKSSFIGAVAVPAAYSNYSAVYQKFIRQLIADPEFQKLTATKQ